MRDRWWMGAHLLFPSDIDDSGSGSSGERAPASCRHARCSTHSCGSDCHADREAIFCTHMLAVSTGPSKSDDSSRRATGMPGHRGMLQGCSGGNMRINSCGGTVDGD